MVSTEEGKKKFIRQLEKAVGEISRPEPGMKEADERAHVHDLVNLSYKCMLAKSKHTQPSILSNLAKSSLAKIRKEVAMNKNTPKDTLKELVKDKNPKVRITACANPSASEIVFEMLENVEILKRVAENKSIFPEDLEVLANYPIEEIREAAAKNTSAQEEMLKKDDRK